MATVTGMTSTAIDNLFAGVATALDAKADLDSGVLSSSQIPANAMQRGDIFTSVKDPTYGAKGDGTTVDTLAIQNAINAVATAGGGTVYLPAGTYVCSGLYLASKVTLAGAGMGATVLQMDPATIPGTNAWVVRVSNGSATAASWVTVRDLTIDGNKIAFTSPAGKMYGYYLGTATLGLVTDCEVTRVEFRNCATYALDVVDALRVAVSDCFSHDNGVSSGSYGACSGYEILGDDVILTNCRAVNNNTKGFTSGESGTVHYRTKFIGCTAQANTSDGFYFHDGLTASSIVSCASRDNGGSGIVLATNSVRNSVVANTVTGNTGNGIRIDSGTYNIVTDNICDSNSIASSGNPEIYILDAAAYNTVADNIVNSNVSSTSIVEHDTSNNNYIFGNTVNKTVTIVGANTTLTNPGDVVHRGDYFINVKNPLYGAKGDGTTDDTVSIQAALTAAAGTASTPGSTVYLPPGIYVTQPLTIPHGVTLRGSGKHSTTLFAKAGLATASYLLSNVATARMVSVMDLRMQGNTANQSTSVINALKFDATGTGVEYTDMRAYANNVHVEDFSGDAFTTADRGTCQITNCVAWNCKGNGFIVGIDNEITNCDAGNCLNGFLVLGNSLLANCKGWYSGYYNNTIQTGIVAAGNGHGFKFSTASSGNACVGLVAQDNAACGIYLTGCDKVVISGWIADSNNNATSGTSHNVLINASYNSTLIGGFSFDRNPPNAARPVSGLLINGSSTNCHVEMATEGLLTRVGSGTNSYQNIISVDQSGGGSTFQAFASSFTPDNSQGSLIDVGALTGNMTVNAPTLPFNSGSRLTLCFTQDATGSRTLTWNAAFRAFSWQPTATANSHSNITFTWNSNAGIWEKISSQN